MYSLFVKRSLDVIFSLVLIVVLLPIMFIIGLIIRNDGGKALFVQKRSGKNGKDFKLFKFRSMPESNNVRDFKKEDEITKFGKFIRKTSLDELPQLFNILKGDMSFVGPRPWITDYSIYFTENQKRRLEVLPGITGLAQSSGRNNLSIKEKINLDIKYVENVNFKTDIYVIIKTIKSVVKKEGAISSKLTIKNELDELRSQFEVMIRHNSKLINSEVYNEQK